MDGGVHDSREDAQAALDLVVAELAVPRGEKGMMSAPEIKVTFYHALVPLFSGFGLLL
jgi:hypothetical protein